jgi:hypothetical protein
MSQILEDKDLGLVDPMSQDTQRQSVDDVRPSRNASKSPERATEPRANNQMVSWGTSALGTGFVCWGLCADRAVRVRSLRIRNRIVTMDDSTCGLQAVRIHVHNSNEQTAFPSCILHLKLKLLLNPAKQPSQHFARFQPNPTLGP